MNTLVGGEFEAGCKMEPEMTAQNYIATVNDREIAVRADSPEDAGGKAVEVYNRKYAFWPFGADEVVADHGTGDRP